MRGTFKTIETADNKFMIGLSDDLYTTLSTKLNFTEIGSYNIFAARVLGFSYGDFLRYARSKYNGIITGKHSKYPIIKFNNRADCNKLCKELTIRLLKI